MSDYQRGPAPGDITRRSNAPATDDQRARWIAQARAGLTGTPFPPSSDAASATDPAAGTPGRVHESEPSTARYGTWAGDADVDPWEVGA